MLTGKYPAENFHHTRHLETHSRLISPAQKCCLVVLLLLHGLLAQLGQSKTLYLPLCPVQSLAQTVQLGGYWAIRPRGSRRVLAGIAFVLGIRVRRNANLVENFYERVGTGISEAEVAILGPDVGARNRLLGSLRGAIDLLPKSLHGLENVIPDENVIPHPCKSAMDLVCQVNWVQSVLGIKRNNRSIGS